MDNISLALMIYVLVFYHEIRDLPSKAGYYFYGVVTTVMLSLATIYAAYYNNLIPRALQIKPDNVEYNFALCLCFAALTFVSMFYMKRKRVIENYVESGYILNSTAYDKTDEHDTYAFCIKCRLDGISFHGCYRKNHT